MNDRCVFWDGLGLQMAYGRGMQVPLEFAGKWNIFHYRNSKQIGQYNINNLITTVGKNSVLDVGFRAQTQISAWYMGLIDNTSFTAIDVSDTMASHAGWIEFYTGYSQATRVQWSPSAASGGSISNATAAQFDITATATLKGVFITSGSGKNGTTGTLWSAAAFAANVSVQNGDQLKLTYSISS